MKYLLGLIVLFGFSLLIIPMVGIIIGVIKKIVTG
jgi:hypothetical protein